MTTKDLQDRIAAYNAAVNEKDRLTEELRQISATVEERKQDLADAMLEAEVPQLTFLGYSWTLTPKTKYSKAAGADVELFEQLRADGLGDLIKETVNANTLQAAMKNIVEENGGELPPEYSGIINEYSFNDILRRKSTKKI